MTNQLERTRAALEAAALLAESRRCAKLAGDGVKIDEARQPARAEWQELAGLSYVRVTDATGGCVGVYRLRTRGELKRLIRPPEELR